jgi:hypothetical protein
MRAGAQKQRAKKRCQDPHGLDPRLQLCADTGLTGPGKFSGRANSIVLEPGHESAHIRPMIERASEANERARERLRSIARRHGLDDANVDFLLIEEIWEALRQFEMGLLPEWLTRAKRQSRSLT